MQRRAFACVTAFLFGALLFAGLDFSVEVKVPPPQSLTQASRWLIGQQGLDGSWRSETYGNLKSGPSITALVLYAWSHLPASLREPHVSAIERAFAWVLAGENGSGAVAAPDGTLDYPTYATAFVLEAADRLGYEIPAERRQAMVAYLIAAQLDEGEGWKPEDLHYGGWDFLGNGQGRRTTGTNVSITAFVAEALDGEDGAERALARVPAFVGRCWTKSGGLAFSPDTEDPMNKAGSTEDGRPRPYGTATCDGIRALLACGSLGDSRLIASCRWLSEQPAGLAVPGFPRGTLPEWRLGLRYYYAAGLGLALSRAEQLQLFERERYTLSQARTSVRALEGQQESDGAWRNPDSSMREDDPLVATPLAVIGLARLTALGRE